MSNVVDLQAHQGRGYPRRRPAHSTDWTPAQVAVLRRGWGIRSARAIGRDVGRSRNAVIGKANRLGLEMQPVGYTTTRRIEALHRRMVETE